MKVITYLAMTAMMISSIAYSEEISSVEKNKVSNCHQFKIGPDAFGLVFQKDRFTDETSRNGFLVGVRASYDYVKPNSIYFGIEAVKASGTNRIHVPHSWELTENYYLRKIDKACVHKERLSFINAEARMGQTVSNGSSLFLFTPFIGLGGYGREKLTEFYTTIGFKANQKLRERFDIGINLKATLTTLSSHSWRSMLGEVFGYEAAIPLSWHMGSSAKWSIQAQPYIQKFGGTDGTFIGSRFLAGYDF